MRLKNFLDDWGLDSLKINVGFLEGEFKPDDPDRSAAWEMYVNLLTRITTQYLAPDEGDESAALQSLHDMFDLTRDTLIKNGFGCTEFAKIAIPVLNQVIRPFTSKWHKRLVDGGISTSDDRARFRTELKSLQDELRNYTRALGAIARVEDFTHLEE